MPSEHRDHNLRRISDPSSRFLDSFNVRSGGQGIGGYVGDGLSEEDDDTVSSNLSGTTIDSLFPSTSILSSLLPL